MKRYLRLLIFGAVLTTTSIIYSVDARGSEFQIPSLSNRIKQEEYKDYILRAIDSLKGNCANIKLSFDNAQSAIINLDIKNAQDQKIGFVQFYIENLEAYLSQISISEQYQGQGFGKPALICFYRLMDKLGVTKTTCTLDSRTPYAAKLYVSVGMRFTHSSLEEIARVYNTFEQFLSNSSSVSTLQMFRVKDNPFESSLADQEMVFNRYKNLSQKK